MSERRSLYSASEHDEQVALFEWASYHPELRFMFAIPNGGARHPAVAVKLKAEGVKRGVPDIFLPLARGGYYGLFIELKTETGRPTREQREWIRALLEENYLAIVCKGMDEAKRWIESYAGIEHD
ncbi:MAG: VRR-NUC domain-containing protein [Bellilinea sp.]